MVDPNAWAMGAINRVPRADDFAGLSYEQASRRAVAICAAAVETGKTVNASMHLEHLVKVMLVERALVA